MKLETGMYVRTKYGITQYREYETDKGKLLCMPLTNGTFANIEDVLKASNNIIDLIEVGDYVNGERVQFITNKCQLLSDGGYDILEKYNDISSIVTKEQFENMAYEVE